MTRTIACLFPAFAMKYRDFSRQWPSGIEEEAALFFDRASAVVEIDMRKFEQPGEFVLDDPLQDDLQDQYTCYVDNCAVGSLLKKRDVAGDYVAGYSMGMFAALFHSSAVSFEDGLRLLDHTCRSVHEAIGDVEYGMGAVVGLTSDEILGLIARGGLQVEVADVCGPRVVIASGLQSDVQQLLAASEAEGSMQSKTVPVTVPYHSSFLRGVDRKITDFLGEIEICSPERAIVSCVDQRVLTSAADIREESTRNVSHPIRWFKTMNRLLELGTNVFVESGLSESLSNLARNIDGDYEFYHPRKFDRLFASMTLDCA